MVNLIVQRALKLRKANFIFGYSDSGHKDVSTARGGHIDYDRPEKKHSEYSDHSERYSDSSHTDEKRYGDYSERSTHTDCNSGSARGSYHVDETKRKYLDHQEHSDTRNIQEYSDGMNPTG